MSSQNTGETPTYEFSLSKADCYDHSQAIKLNFQNSNYCPVFNHDKQHSTPAFLVPQEKAYYKTNITIVQLKFSETVERQLAKSANCTRERLLQIPELARPSSNFCQICRMEYSSYPDHLDNENHLKRVNSSLGQKYIIELTAGLSMRALLPSFPTKKLKNIKKNKFRNKQSAKKPSYPSYQCRTIFL